MTADLDDGAEIAGFRVETLLGRGGMASVYLARDLQLDRRVALKVLAPELAASPQFQRRFHRESRLLASLDHANIVPVYQAGDAGGLLYIAMRYVEGSDLGVLLEREGRLEPQPALKVLTQVCAALQAAHEAGLVHRDVKPANVLISRSSSRHSAGHVYLTDFGLTKQLSSMSQLTAVGNVMGTMQYLAPEQISGRPVEPRTDVYALGGLAFRCLTGHVPFERSDDAALLWAHLSEAAPPASELSPDLPEAVDDVIWTAMAKRPEDRFESAADFADALAAALSSRAALAVGPASVPAQVRPEPALAETSRPPVAASAERASGASQPLRELPRTPPPAHPHDGPARFGGGNGSGRSRPPVRSRRRLLVGGVALVLLLVGSAGAVALRGGDGGGPELAEHYPADGVLTFGVDVPATWTYRSGGGTSTALAPQPGPLLALFRSSGSAGSWQALWDVAQRDPTAASGLYTFFTATAYDPAAQVADVLAPLLPSRASFAPGHATEELDGTTAYVHEGDLTNPADEGQRLHFVAYVVERQDADARMVHLLFVAPASHFDEQRRLFERIADTVDFP